MDKKTIYETLDKLKQEDKKRNFNQSFDLIVNLKDIDLKKTDNQIEFFLPLHYPRGKQLKVCALVDTELKEEAEKVCDKTIMADDFQKYAKDKKAAKKLADEFDIFIAQATIMPKVASAFGRIFGPRGKMPNPKGGCVVSPKANLKSLYEKLQKQLKISIKSTPSFKCSVGKEDQKAEEVIDNIITIYNNLIHHLPAEKNNIKKMLLKLTMSKPIEVN